MDSLQIAASLKRYGFEQVEDKTHALGFEHPAMGGQRIYLKVSRSERKEKPKAVAKQPLVLHPLVAKCPGFDATRVASLGPNYRYKNTNMSTFPYKPGESATGITVDIPDSAALLELLVVLGLPAASVGGQKTDVTAAPAPVAMQAPHAAAPAAPPTFANSHVPEPAAEPVLRKSQDASTRFHAATDIDFSLHCCQGKGQLKAGLFELDALTMAVEGPRRLRFAPLGNRPSTPKLALVGITPGGQIEAFASALATQDVPGAASHAAFRGAQKEIKQLLAAHGFADRLGIDLEGDLNHNPSILTTSVVKCCLMVDDGYRFAAPDIAASTAALRCATERLVNELRGYPTLQWVVVFGQPAWDALHELSFEGQPVISALRDAGMRVVQLPHFKQNFQQRALYSIDSVEEARLLAAKPHFTQYVEAPRRMRRALLENLEQSAT